MSKKSEKKENKENIKPKDIILAPSTRVEKKYMVKVDNKTIHFGAAGYSDYPQHLDDQRKSRYLKRHRADPNKIDTAGFWARNMLWNKDTIPKSIRDIEQKTGRNIVVK